MSAFSSRIALPSRASWSTVRRVLFNRYFNQVSRAALALPGAALVAPGLLKKTIGAPFTGLRVSGAGLAGVLNCEFVAVAAGASRVPRARRSLPRRQK
jgi:hypothetical protein